MSETRAEQLQLISPEYEQAVARVTTAANGLLMLYPVQPAVSNRFIAHVADPNMQGDEHFTISKSLPKPGQTLVDWYTAEPNVRCWSVMGYNCSIWAEYEVRGGIFYKRRAYDFEPFLDKQVQVSEEELATLAASLESSTRWSRPEQSNQPRAIKRRSVSAVIKDMLR